MVEAMEIQKGFRQTEVGVIPSDWKVQKLTNIAEICTGSTPPTSDQNNYGDDYYFVSPADLGKGRIILNTEKKLSLKGFNLSRKYPKNSILFTCIGSTIGKSGIADIELTSNQQINAIFPNNTFDSDYLYYLLNLLANKIKESAGETAVPIINKTEFGELSFPLPPTKAEQTAIATALNDADALITQLEKLIAKKRAIKQGAMQELLKPKDGWEVKKLGDIAQQIRRSVNPDKINPTTPYIGLEHIPRKSITLSEWGTANEVKSTKLAFEKGEILFGKIRPYFHKVGVAPIDGVCSSDAIVISSIVSDYFFIVLGCVSSEEFVNHSSQTSQGTKMPRADWSVLVNYPIAIPPQPILLHFNEFINNILSQIQNMVFRNRNLRRTRNLLLPKLISGKVNVDT